MVALVPRTLVDVATGAPAAAVPTWGDAADLCAGEPFANEPALALCSGILVDWDLVLTAGHCTHLLPLDQISILFGYYHTAPGTLAVSEESLYEPIAIVAERWDPPGSEPRLDYAWLRLNRAVEPPFAPAAVLMDEPAPQAELVAISTPGGVPVKVDEGGRIQSRHDPWFDYFVADTDTVRGSSGGGAFDRDSVLLGIMARGRSDFSSTPEGCQVGLREPDATRADEQFTYARRAVDGLCRSEGKTSTLCRANCGAICQAEPLSGNDAVAGVSGGCAIDAQRAKGWMSWVFVVLVIAAARGRRGAARRLCPRG